MAEADKDKASAEGSEGGDETTVTEETVVEETVVTEESEASTSGKKKKKGKKGGAKKGKKGAAAAPGSAKGKQKKKKKKKVAGSVVWAYPRQAAIGPSYSPCPHIFFKHSVADRSKLDQKKYDILLATPKTQPWQQPPEELQKFKRRLITPRTECLALPTKRKMAAQLQEYAGVLSPQMVDNLATLLETNCDLTASPVVIYPKGTSAETTYYLREWVNWLYESYNKMSSFAGELQKLASDTQDRVNEHKLSTKPKTEKNKQLAELAWKQIEAEIAARARDWKCTKKSIVSSAKQWEKFMKTRPDKKHFDSKSKTKS